MNGRRIDERIVREAAVWLVRLQSTSHEAAILSACNDWRNQHPDHDLAWQRLQAISGEFSGQLGRSGSANLFARTLSGASQGVDRRQILKMLSIVAIGGAAWSMRDKTPWQRWTADFATATGERRTYQLPDDSQLQLDTRSAVDLQFTDSERLLVLTQGGLRLITGHDSRRRPLRVSTRHATFEALGTTFTLRQEQGPSRLEVEQGAVAVTTRAGASTVIEAGSGCLADDAGIHALQNDGIKAGGWADGVIDTQSMRLGNFIAEVARYRPGYLGCDASVADLRLSGVYRLDDTDQLLQAVQQLLPVTVVYRTRWWVNVTAVA